MSTKIDFHLHPDSRLDAKWLKTDLEEALKKNMVPHYWNELLKDNELIVHGCYTSKDSATSDSGIIFFAYQEFQILFRCYFYSLYFSVSSDYSRINLIENQSSSKKFKTDFGHLPTSCGRSEQIIDSWVFNKTNGNYL